MTQGAPAGGDPDPRPRRWRAARAVLVVVEAFVALTAIGGGIALAAGLEGGRFPLAWLAGTPFADYTVPGLLLAVLVGGSASVAFVALLVRPAAGAAASMAAGLVLGGWIAGEVALVTADGVVVSPTEAVYLALAVLAVVLGALCRRAARSGWRRRGA